MTATSSAPEPGHRPAGAQSPASMRRLGRNTLIYSAGVLFHRILSVAMLPVYTRVMTPADYGVLDLLQMMTDVVALVLTAGLQRFYFQASDDEERRAIVSTAFLMQLGLALIGTITLLLFADLIATRFLGGAGTPRMVAIAAFNFSLGMLVSLPLTVLQTEERAGFFLVVTVAKLVLQLGLNLVFLLIFRMGAEGILLSTLVTSVLIGSWLAAWLVRRAGLHFSWHWLRELRRFGVPYQLSWAASFLLTFGDRFFLQAAKGATSVGIYGMAYQFGFILAQVAGTPFLQAWRPQRFQMVDAPRERRDAATTRGFFYLSAILLTGATATCLFVEPFLRIMTTKSFFGAATMVPVIAFAYVIETWANAVSFGIEVSAKTRYTALATWTSSIVALALYSILIPTYGGYGAALGTVGGFALRLALVYHWSQRLWPVKYGWRRPALMALTSAAATAVYLWVRPDSWEGQLGCGVGLMLAYLLVLWHLILEPSERELVGRALHDMRHALQILARGA